jgi:hypothetical protein
LAAAGRGWPEGETVVGEEAGREQGAASVEVGAAYQKAEASLEAGVAYPEAERSLEAGAAEAEGLEAWRRARGDRMPLPELHPGYTNGEVPQLAPRLARRRGRKEEAAAWIAVLSVPRACA